MMEVHTSLETDNGTIETTGVLKRDIWAIHLAMEDLTWTLDLWTASEAIDPMRYTKQVISSHSQSTTRLEIMSKLRARAAIIKNDHTLATHIQEGLAQDPIEFQDRRGR